MSGDTGARASTAGVPGATNAAGRPGRIDAAPGGALQQAVPAAPADDTRTPPRAMRAQPDQDAATVAPVPAPAIPSPAVPARSEPRGVRVDDLALEVIVYAAAPEERSAWINGRRYVEGQRLPGGFVIESIRPDAVVLSGQGRQTVLQQQQQ